MIADAQLGQLINQLEEMAQDLNVSPTGDNIEMLAWCLPLVTNVKQKDILRSIWLFGKTRKEAAELLETSTTYIESVLKKYEKLYEERSE